MRVLILSNSDAGLYHFRKELIEELIHPGAYIENRGAEPCQVYLALPDGEFILELKKMGCQFINISVDRRGMNPIKGLSAAKEFDREKEILVILQRSLGEGASICVDRVDEIPVLQEFLDGQEFGADVYVDMISSEVVSIFTKKKISMRAGETDKAVSFKDDKLFELIVKFVRESGWTGQIDIDIFDVNGEYYISEVNPRFGGGYPYAYECGCDHIELIVENLLGKENQKKIGAYNDGTFMMKNNEIMVKTL